ncbi:hypothetical protein PGQ11_008091 [Apiospora arundinis]|uniref:Uncharacterized protein n=1 Tax=Apiospora arundinis TaxID=335852 RepID=A0ABR2IDZ1_9PEZI
MSVDLTLPAGSSPAIDPYKDLPEPILPFALFVHVNLSGGEEELASIEATCNSQTDTHDYAVVQRRAPRYDFAGQPLHAALTEHLDNLEELVQEGRFSAFYFVAVVDEDWKEKGLIIVTMGDGIDEDYSHIGQMRVAAEDVSMLLVNLHIGNTDWEECKENYEIDADDGDATRDQNEDSPPNRADEVPQLWNSAQTDEEYSDGAGKPKPYADLCADYWQGFYARPGIDFETVMRDMYPAWGGPHLLSELNPRPEGRVPVGSQEAAVACAKRLHPMRCRNNPRLFRGMFFIVDTPNYAEEGFLLVKMDWDEKQVENGDVGLAELAALGEAAGTDTQRVEHNNADAIAFLESIKVGHRPWKHTHKTFLAYAGPQTRFPADYLQAVDPAFQKRHSGGQRFLDRNVQGYEAEVWFHAALEQHWGFADEERFMLTLCSAYFIYCDMKLSKKDTDATVALVKVDRDDSKGWSSMECKAGDAYRLLCDLVDGKREWAGQKTVPVWDGITKRLEDYNAHLASE